MRSSARRLVRSRTAALHSPYLSARLGRPPFFSLPARSRSRFQHTVSTSLRASGPFQRHSRRLTARISTSRRTAHRCGSPPAVAIATELKGAARLERRQSRARTLRVICRLRRLPRGSDLPTGRMLTMCRLPAAAFEFSSEEFDPCERLWIPLLLQPPRRPLLCFRLVRTARGEPAKPFHRTRLGAA